MNGMIWTFCTGFVGVHVGWYWLQQTHVPEEQRHDHPVIKLYKAYLKSRKDND